MTPDLRTTNLFLGVIALSSLIEMLVIALLCLGLFLMARRLMQLIKTVEKQQLAPAAERVHAILDDVKGMTGTAKAQADRMEWLVRWALGALRRFGGGT